MDQPEVKEVKKAVTLAPSTAPTHTPEEIEAMARAEQFLTSPENIEKFRKSDSN
jgi:hypothetical protein